MFLLSAIHNTGPRGRQGYLIGIFIFVALGLSSSIRQIWLTMQPPTQHSMCLPVTFLIQQGAFVDLAKLLFTGGSECGEVKWRFLTLSMPAWSAILFSLFGITALWRWRR